jgi:hypothetical protein
VGVRQFNMLLVGHETETHFGGGDITDEPGAISPDAPAAALIRVRRYLPKRR